MSEQAPDRSHLVLIALTAILCGGFLYAALSASRLKPASVTITHAETPPAAQSPAEPLFPELPGR